MTVCVLHGQDNLKTCGWILMKFSGWIAVMTKSRVTFGADPHHIPHYRISILPLCRRYAVSRMPF